MRRCACASRLFKRLHSITPMDALLIQPAREGHIPGVGGELLHEAAPRNDR